jgi:hypothetical protein
MRTCIHKKLWECVIGEFLIVSNKIVFRVRERRNLQKYPFCVFPFLFRIFSFFDKIFMKIDRNLSICLENRLSWGEKNKNIFILFPSSSHLSINPKKKLFSISQWARDKERSFHLSDYENFNINFNVVCFEQLHEDWSEISIFRFIGEL